MFVDRVTKVAVGARKNPAKPRKAGRKKTGANPAHLLSLGWVNPKRTKGSSTMAKKAGRPKASQNKKKAKAPNPGTKIVVIGPKQNKGGQYTVRSGKKKSRNPHFFGQNAAPLTMGKYIAAGLGGLTVHQLAVPMMPEMFRQSSITTSITAVAVAAAEWWIAAMADKDLGAAVGYGALMSAGAMILNQVAPSIGARVPIRGVRRNSMGDFINADRSAFLTSLAPNIAAVPGNGAAMRSAYPSAYGMAA